MPARVVTAVVPLGYPVADIPSLIAALSSRSAAELKVIAPGVVNAATEAMRGGYSDAFNVTWLVSIPFGVVALVTAIFVRDPSPYFTPHTAVTLEKGRLTPRRQHTGVLEEHATIQLETGAQSKVAVRYRVVGGLLVAPALLPPTD